MIMGSKTDEEKILCNEIYEEIEKSLVKYLKRKYGCPKKFGDTFKDCIINPYLCDGVDKKNVDNCWGEFVKQHMRYSADVLNSMVSVLMEPLGDNVEVKVERVGNNEITTVTCDS